MKRVSHYASYTPQDHHSSGRQPQSCWLHVLVFTASTGFSTDPQDRVSQVLWILDIGAATVDWTIGYHDEAVGGDIGQEVGEVGSIVVTASFGPDQDRQ